jgi:hypothetical protein
MDHSTFEREEGGARLTAFVLASTVFFDGSVRARAKGILEAWRAFLAWCPDDALRFYSTETMSKHEPLRSDTLDMLGAWFAPDAPLRKMVSYEVKDGTRFDDTPHWSFLVVGVENDDEFPAMVQITVPADVADGPSRLRAFTGALITRLTAIHAVAGYAMAVSPYREEASQTFAWGRSMRYRGVDILLGQTDRVTVGKDGVKGVNWLTYLDGARVDRLGGKAALRKSLASGVDMVSVNDGFMLQAGSEPETGDENRQQRLPRYKSVFAAVEPIAEPSFDRALDLVLEDLDEASELSLRWRRRLAG